jgi:hypothetical protein
MCIRVQYACVKSSVAQEPYDAGRRVITVPRCLSRTERLAIVRAILTELAVPQCHVGARCFCGAPIEASPSIPQQMRRTVTHGA